MSIATSVLDTTGFVRAAGDVRKDKGRTPKRMPMPAEVISMVRGGIPLDTRKQGETGGLPTEHDIYLQLLELGLSATKAQMRTEKTVVFTTKELAIPNTTEYVLWTPKDIEASVNEVLEEYNAYLESQMLKKIAGYQPIMCALVRRGLVHAPIKNLVIDYE